MSHSTLTKRIEFSASHRYHNPSWDSAKNRAIFGACNNEPSHGHNYLLEVTVGGGVDPVTGMIINLYDLKQILLEVLEEFDHKHLNLDTPYFQQIIPTTENLARVFWNVISRQPKIGKLEAIRVYEGEGLFSEVTAGNKWSDRSAPDMRPVTVTRQYQLTAGTATPNQAVTWSSHRLNVTIAGPIDQETGRVTDLAALDTLVNLQILKRFDQHDLANDPDIHPQPATRENVVRLIWQLLSPHISDGRLAKLTLTDSQGNSVHYRG